MQPRPIPPPHTRCQRHCPPSRGQRPHPNLQGPAPACEGTTPCPPAHWPCIAPASHAVMAVSVCIPCTPASQASRGPGPLHVPLLCLRLLCLPTWFSQSQCGLSDHPSALLYLLRTSHIPGTVLGTGTQKNLPFSGRLSAALGSQTPVYVVVSVPLSPSRPPPTRGARTGACLSTSWQRVHAPCRPVCEPALPSPTCHPQPGTCVRVRARTPCPPQRSLATGGNCHPEPPSPFLTQAPMTLGGRQHPLSLSFFVPLTFCL